MVLEHVVQVLNHKSRPKSQKSKVDWPLWHFGNRHMGPRLIMGCPGPVAYHAYRKKKKWYKEGW